MILPLLQSRRSIRKFEKRPLEPEKIELLTEALLRAPSSRGRTPWEFILVDDPALLRQLGQAKAHGSSFIADAPLAVVVAADPQRSDVWIEDCAIAAILLQMTAHSLGLGSCWVQIRLRQHQSGRSSDDQVRELLQLPADQQILAIVAIGYPAEQLPGHPRQTLLWEKVHRNGYGQDR
ncbi:MAG: nitroreductase family protein [Desulfuromonadales bacterium]|nr:nitroreductase family protein [Desulfuromonadales bacterium]